MTSIQKYQEEMKKIQDYILGYLDNDDKVEENYENLKLLFNDIKIHDDPHKIKPTLYILASKVNNHYRKTPFFAKIERILNLFKEDMTKYFSNLEIFNIFRKTSVSFYFFLKKKLLQLIKE